MSPRLWMLVLLGWLFLGPAVPAHAAAGPPRAEVHRLPGSLTPAAPHDVVRVVADRFPVCQAAGRLRSRQVRPSAGAWPLIPVARGLSALLGSEALRALASWDAQPALRGRPSSPRAPPSSC